MGPSRPCRGGFVAARDRLFSSVHPGLPRDGFLLRHRIPASSVASDPGTSVPGQDNIERLRDRSQYRFPSDPIRKSDEGGDRRNHRVPVHGQARGSGRAPVVCSVGPTAGPIDPHHEAGHSVVPEVGALVFDCEAAVGSLGEGPTVAFGYSVLRSDGGHGRSTGCESASSLRPGKFGAGMPGANRRRDCWCHVGERPGKFQF